MQRKSVFNSCNGRCELQKSIKKYADNEKKQDSLKEKLELVYVQNSPEVKFSIITVLESKENSTILYEKKPIKASTSSKDRRPSPAS